MREHKHDIVVFAILFCILIVAAVAVAVGVKQQRDAFERQLKTESAQVANREAIIIARVEWRAQVRGCIRTNRRVHKLNVFTASYKDFVATVMRLHHIDIHKKIPTFGKTKCYQVYPNPDTVVHGGRLDG